MLSKSQIIVYEAIITRLNEISKVCRNSDVSSIERQSVLLWIDSLNLEDNCREILCEPRYTSPCYINGSPVIQMMTMTPSRTILEPSKEAISKTQEIKEMSDEEIIALAKQMGIKL